MIRTNLCVAALVLLAACGTTNTSSHDYSEFSEASTFLEMEINERIGAIEFQTGQELYTNLVRISYIGEPAIPYLVDALEHDSARTRASCAYILGNLRDRRTIPDLQDALADDVAYVRYEVAAALVNIGERDGYPVLIQGLADDEIRNRYKAHEALKVLTKLDFGYHHDDEPTDRRLAILKWEEWWSRMESQAL